MNRTTELEIEIKKINMLNTINQHDIDNDTILFTAINNISETTEDKQKYIDDFIKNKITLIASVAGKNHREINLQAKINYKKTSNEEIYNTALSSLKKIFNFYKDDKNTLIYIKNNHHIKNNINNMAIDSRLNSATLFLLGNNNSLADNMTLNISIRNGNKEIFDQVINNFNGKKNNFDNLQENPFFWQPHLFNKNKDFSAKYIYDKLLDHDFIIDKKDLKNIMEVFKNNPERLSYYADLKKRVETKNTQQRSLSF